jgi:hypothetical protein
MIVLLPVCPESTHKDEMMLILFYSDPHSFVYLAPNRRNSKSESRIRQSASNTSINVSKWSALCLRIDG